MQAVSPACADSQASPACTGLPFSPAYTYTTGPPPAASLVAATREGIGPPWWPRSIQRGPAQASASERRQSATGAGLSSGTWPNTAAHTNTRSCKGSQQHTRRSLGLQPRDLAARLRAGPHQTLNSAKDSVSPSPPHPPGPPSAAPACSGPSAAAAQQSAQQSAPRNNQSRRPAALIESQVGLVTAGRLRLLSRGFGS